MTSPQKGATSSDQSALRTSTGTGRARDGQPRGEAIAAARARGWQGRPAAPQCCIAVGFVSTPPPPVQRSTSRAALAATPVPGLPVHLSGPALQTAARSRPRCTRRAGSTPRRCGPAATALLAAAPRRVPACGGTTSPPPRGRQGRTPAPARPQTAACLRGGAGGRTVATGQRGRSGGGRRVGRRQQRALGIVNGLRQCRHGKGRAGRTQSHQRPTWHVLPALHAPHEIKLAVRKGLAEGVCRRARVGEGSWRGVRVGSGELCPSACPALPAGAVAAEGSRGQHRIRGIPATWKLSRSPKPSACEIWFARAACTGGTAPAASALARLRAALLRRRVCRPAAHPSPFPCPAPRAPPLPSARLDGAQRDAARLAPKLARDVAAAAADAAADVDHLWEPSGSAAGCGSAGSSLRAAPGPHLACPQLRAPATHTGTHRGGPAPCSRPPPPQSAASPQSYRSVPAGCSWAARPCGRNRGACARPAAGGMGGAGVRRRGQWRAAAAVAATSGGDSQRARRTRADAPTWTPTAARTRRRSWRFPP